MLSKIKKTFASYSKEFWIFQLVITLITIVMLTVNSYNGSDGAKILIATVYVSAVLCILILQDNRKYGCSIFELLLAKITGIGLKDDDTGKMAALQNKTFFSVQAALSWVFLFFLFYQLIMGNNLILGGMYITVLVLSIVFMRFASIGRVNKFKLPLYIYGLLFAPLIINLLTNAYARGVLLSNLLWMLIGLLLSVVLLSRQKSSNVFKLFVLLLFIYLLIDIVILKRENATGIVDTVLTLLYFGFALFSSFQMYASGSMQNHEEMENTVIRLKDAQSLLVQKEKMVTLGQLIAGVAHEINTPIGAIKACGENLEVSSQSMFRKLIEGCRDFSDEDVEIFLMLVQLSSDSIKEMRNTMELRRAKNALKKYFEAMELPDANELVDCLAKLELCDMEKIESNIDYFTHPNILKILRTVTVVLPYINATQSIQFASGKVTKIVFALKSYARTNISNEFVMFDVVKNIENVLVLYHNQLKSDIELEKDFDEDIPHILGNSDELSQVWTNLVQNAIYAMSGTGKLRLSIKKTSDNHIVVSIADSGEGISEERINRIFDPFYTTKPLGEGSGLGLDICKKIIVKHNGKIDVTSQVGVGTTFTIRLPINAS